MRLTSTSLVALALLGAAVGAGGCAKRAPAREPVTVHREQTVSAMATVEAVDQKTRMVTLRAADGRPITFRAGPEVRNLPQVKVGDQVIATYYEELAAEVRKPTDEEAANPKTLVGAVGRAPLGDKPAAAAGQSLRVVATITGIDRTSEHVTLTGPEGRSITVKARDPKNLAAVNVGDTVVITYTEAVAISVEEAPKK